MTRLLKTKEVAALLGISRITLYRYIKQGDCPVHSVLPSGVMLFEESAVLEWLKRRQRGGKRSK